MPRHKKYYPLHRRRERNNCDCDSCNSCDEDPSSDDYDYYDYCNTNLERCDSCNSYKCKCRMPPPGAIPPRPICNTYCNYMCTGPYTCFGNTNTRCCGPPVNLDWCEAMGGWSYSLNVGWIPIVPGSTEPYPSCCK